MPYSEFHQWMEYLSQAQWYQWSKSDWYLAQIAAEVRRSFVVDANKINTSDFLLQKASEVETSVEAEQWKDSKSAWVAILGVDASKRN